MFTKTSGLYPAPVLYLYNPSRYSMTSILYAFLIEYRPATYPAHQHILDFCGTVLGEEYKSLLTSLGNAILCVKYFLDPNIFFSTLSNTLKLQSSITETMSLLQPRLWPGGGGKAMCLSDASCFYELVS
jgi:hypothetical protein